jgi:polyisoprenoid-binding protein YceI
MALKTLLPAIVLATVAAVGPALASNNYTIDPQHSSVSFMVPHGKWSKYQGLVRKIAGDIVFEKEHIEESSVRVRMDAKSVDTLNVERDNEVQGFGFLYASKNPDITFASTSVEKTSEKTGKIIGNLTMAGVTHPVTLDVIFDGEGVSPWDNFQRVAFSATGTLDTNDFGLKDLTRLGIGPKLDFKIEVEATTY